MVDIRLTRILASPDVLSVPHPERCVRGPRVDLLPLHGDAVDGALVAGVRAAEGAGLGVVGAHHAVTAAGEDYIGGNRGFINRMVQFLL